MVLNESRQLKRVKRKISDDLNDFFVFPAGFEADKPFRDGVRSFVKQFGRETFPSSLFPSLVAWHILFRVGDHVVDDGPDSQQAVFALDVIEEDVATSERSIYCDQCRVVGWGAHPVCRKRYHFIIRVDNSPLEGYKKPCSSCGNLHELSESSCNSCNFMITSYELEDWIYRQFEQNTHLLHGVVHSNGYGHLLRVNGREGGSKLLSGCDIMDFWDRLCQALAVRKVSVMDVSKKYGMEYRLLNAVTKGYSWYGNWGYEFGSGCYGLTPEAYQEAIHTLSMIPLSPFLFHWRRPQSQLQAVIAFYKLLSVSELLTMKDLFSFLLSLIQNSHKTKASKSLSSNSLCVWTVDDVERVQQSMVKVLLAATSEGSWVSWRALKGSVFKMGSPELIDYCLKHFGGKSTTNGSVVRSRFNPNHGAFEFRLEPQSCVHSATEMDSTFPSKQQLIQDLKFLYESLLNDETMVSCGPKNTRENVVDATTKLIDCKYFVKDYKSDKMTTENPFALHYWCHMEPLHKSKNGPSPPSELIILPRKATIADLKSEAAKAFQEVYALFNGFVLEKLPEFDYVEDYFSLKLLVGLSGSICIKGKCPANYVVNKFRMERGMENWKVDCMCGAKDDDGERMLACDTCGVWLHTRCAGIANLDAIPEKYVCPSCVNSTFKKSKRVSDSGLKTSVASTFKKSKRVSNSCSKKAGKCAQSGKVSRGICRTDLVPTEFVCLSCHESVSNEYESVSDSFNQANSVSASSTICTETACFDPIPEKVVCTIILDCKETIGVSPSDSIPPKLACEESKITAHSCMEGNIVSPPAMICKHIASSYQIPAKISSPTISHSNASKVIPYTYKKTRRISPLHPVPFSSNFINTECANLSCPIRRCCSSEALMIENHAVRSDWSMKFEAVNVK